MNNTAESQDSMAPNESLKDLLQQLATDSAAMVRDEIALVVQGVREKVATLRRASLLIAGGAVLLLLAAMALCAAVVIQLATFMAPELAALLVAVALGLIGAFILYTGSKLLKQ